MSVNLVKMILCAGWISIALAILVILFVCMGGCVTMGKQMYRDYKGSQPTPLLTPTPLPTPEPESIPHNWINASEYVPPPESFADQMYRTGGRWQGEWFTWHRENVSGLKDMTVRVTVYGHRFLYGYWWYSDSWARYYFQEPQENQKFLFIYVHMEMVGDDESQDPRMYGMGDDHFYIQYGNFTLTRDTEHQPGLRIKEFEETFTLNDDARISDYGYDTIWYDGYNEDKEFWAGYLATDKGYLRMGKSNAWDGYIGYQVPITSTEDDLIVLGRFDGFGNAYWYLKNKGE